MLADLKLAMDALESKAGVVTTANDAETGMWLRIRRAAETIAGTTGSALDNMLGNMLRTAVALEATAGTSGAEENVNYHGYLKRIVDALEVKAGQVYTGTLERRFVLAAQNATFNPYAAYALALDFDNPEYWVSRTQYNPVSALPGYTFTRTGEQGAVDSTGAVSYYAANVPAINNRGYHAYGALTNLEIQSQTFGSRTLFSLTVTANTTTSPDGTANADTLTATATGLTYASVNVAFTAAAYTTSVFLHKTAGTAPYAYIRSNGPALAVSITVDKATGAITGNGLAAPTASYAVDCGTYWRIVMAYTAAAGAQEVFHGPANASNTRDATNGQTIVMWQAQTLLGNIPDGGPIIVTAAATASIGASIFNATHPMTADQDFVVYAVYDPAKAVATAPEIIFQLGVWNVNAVAAFRHTTGNIEFAHFHGSVGVSSAILVGGNPANRVVVLYRRRGGKDTYAVRYAGANTLSAESGAVGYGPSNVLQSGYFTDGAAGADGSVEGVFIRTGTFSDADIATILEAA